MKKLFLLALVALGVALAVPSSRAKIVVPISNRIKQEIVPRRLGAIAGMVEARLRTGRGLPPARSFESWMAANSSSSATDPWGNVYWVEGQRDGFVVGSNGPDGQRGTADDITERRSFDPS